jgi:flagellar biosynthesis GTPase FlhF|nr:hypothetical protein [Candidatus Krumholzibacteria bacterium]
MVSQRKARPSADDQPIVVTAPTLKDAYRRIKQTYGDDAVILDSKSISRRQSLGLGHERMVEVTVHPPGTPLPRHQMGRSPLGSSTADRSSRKDYPPEIAGEIDRIENLVRNIHQEFDERDRQARTIRDNPLGWSMMAAGASEDTVQKLFTRFTSASGKPVSDTQAATSWLMENLRASNCSWEGFYGCHAFLGRSGSGRTALVHEAAAKLQSLGRKTLVLAVMPGHTGEVRRLQAAASEHGFDAAVIQDRNQLVKSESHLTRYDAVLVDLPALDHPAMALGEALHIWLAENPGFHRHLVIPMDGDPRDLGELEPLAKEWHNDWVAVTRCDLSRRPGKFLDLAEIFPVPFSLLGSLGSTDPGLAIASSGGILDRVLAQAETSQAGQQENY